MPLGNQFAVEITFFEPERAEEPAMLVAGGPGHPHPARGEFLVECVAGCAAVGLVKLGRIDAQETDLHGPPGFIDAGHGVAIIDHCHPPQRPAGGIVLRAHRYGGGDCRDQRGERHIPRPQVAGQAAGDRRNAEVWRRHG